MQIAFWITLTPWTRPSSSTDKRKLTLYALPALSLRTLYHSSFHSSVYLFIFSSLSFPSLFLSFSLLSFFCCNRDGTRHIHTFFTTRAAFVTLLVTPPDLLAADGIIFLILYMCAAKPTCADKSLLEENCRCAAFTIFVNFFVVVRD